MERRTGVVNKLRKDRGDDCPHGYDGSALAKTRAKIRSISIFWVSCLANLATVSRGAVGFKITGAMGQIRSGQRRWLGLVAGLGLVGSLGLLPVRAEIISIGLEGADLPSLSEDEQTLLEQLQAVRYLEILSTPSPDGTTLVVAVSGRLAPSERSLHFLDLSTGELSDALSLQNEIVSPDLPLRWVDNDTLRFAQQDPFGPWMVVTLNRATNIASRTQVYPTQEESGAILGMSPDFSKLVIQVFEGEEDVIYIVFLDSLRRLEVARVPKGLSLEPPAWSADGNQVALLIDSEEERRLYDRTPTSPNLASPVIQDALGRLAAAENPLRQHNTLRVYDFSQAQPLRVELSADPIQGHALAAVSLSPDGQRMLVKRHRPAQLSGRSQPSHLFPESAYYEIYDLTGQRLERLDFPALQGPTESAGQFLDKDRLLFWGTRGYDRTLWVYHLSQRRLRPLPLPSGAIDPAALTATADGNTIIYSFSAVTQPPELYRIAADGSALPEAITQVNGDLVDINRVQVDPVQLPSRHGTRSGFLIQPADRPFPPQQVPLVFWQQGGPGFPMLNEFAVEVEMPLNLLPNFGIAVLVMPLTGREGFGPEFFRAQADAQNFGHIDLEEGRDVVDALVQAGWARPDQVGVSGCSYGGYYAAQITSQYPDLFAASNPQCSLLDLLTEWQLGYSSLLSYLVGQTPMENPAAYLAISPLYNAATIRTPTLMFHGADDFLQIDVARNFHDVVDGEGVPITLYEFQDTGHSLTDPFYQGMAAQLQIDFFRQYLAD